MSQELKPCPERSETDLEFLKLHYEDTVARIAEAKLSQWRVLQWTMTLVGAVVGLKAAHSALPVLLVQQAIMFSGAAGVVVLLVGAFELAALRERLMQIRKYMGGWVRETFVKDPKFLSRWLAFPGQVVIVAVATVVAFSVIGRL